MKGKPKQKLISFFTCETLHKFIIQPIIALKDFTQMSRHRFEHRYVFGCAINVRFMTSCALWRIHVIDKIKYKLRAKQEKPHEVSSGVGLIILLKKVDGENHGVHHAPYMPLSVAGWRSKPEQCRIGGSIANTAPSPSGYPPTSVCITQLLAVMVNLKLGEERDSLLDIYRTEGRLFSDRL